MFLDDTGILIFLDQNPEPASADRVYIRPGLILLANGKVLPTDING